MVSIRALVRGKNNKQKAERKRDNRRERGGTDGRGAKCRRKDCG
jgi:hypothetical protein